MLALTILAAWAAFPGDVVEEISYRAAGCTSPTHHTKPGLCFTVFGHHPSLSCRAPDQACNQTGQRVTSALEYEQDGACLIYKWTWSCAYERRERCGNHWCDPLATCLNDTLCICPESMVGDAAWSFCSCPKGLFQNGTDCEAWPTLPEPIMESDTQNDTKSNNTLEKPECDEGIATTTFALVVAASTIVALLLGVCIGALNLHASTVMPLPEPSPLPGNLARQAQPLPEIRHHPNLMYESSQR